MANRYWVGGTGTWNTSSTTNWSASSGGTGGASVPTAADSVFFDQAATYTVTMTGALLCLDFTVSAGTVTFATGTTPTSTISGSWSITAATVWNSTGLITLNAGSGTRTISTNGITINANIFISGNGSAIFNLGSALTLGSTQLLTIDRTQTGSFNFNGFDITTGIVSMDNGVTTRTINFGNNNVYLVHPTPGTLVVVLTTLTGFVWSGTGGFKADASVTRTYRIGDVAGGSTTTAPNLSITSGSAIPTIGTGSWINNLDFTGSSCTPAVTALNLNGLTLSTGGTFTNLSATMRGTGTITTNGKSIAAFTVNTAGTVTFSGALGVTTYTQTTGAVNFATNNLSCSGAVSYTAGTLSNIGTISCTTWTVTGTFTFGQGTITPSTSFVLTSGSFTYNVGATLSAVPTFTHTAGTVTLNQAYALTATGTYTFVAGTITLGANLTTGIFSSAVAGVRAIAFSANNIVLAHTTAAQTVLNMAVATTFTYTGTGGFVSDASVTRTYTFGTTGGTSANAPNLSITSGAAVPTFTTGSWFNTLDFTGSSTTPAASVVNVNAINLSTGGTYTSLGVTMVGTGTLTINGKAIAAFTVNNGAGTATLSEALSCTTYTHTAGTINFATFNLTCSAGASVAAGTLNNIGTISCTTWAETGTFALSSGTISASTSFTVTSGSFTYNVGGTITTPVFVHTAGTVTLNQALTLSGSYTLTAGTLTLGANLTASSFIASGTSTRAIAFSTNQITLTGNNATIWDGGSTGITYTGTPTIVSTYAGSVGTRTINVGTGWTEATAFDVKAGSAVGISIGTSGTDTVAVAGNIKVFDLTGMLFTYSAGVMTVYNDFTIPATGGTIAASSSTTTFASTNATPRNINSNGRILDFPITFSGVGGTFNLSANLTTGATRTTTIVGGILGLNGFDLTTGIFASSGTATRSISFGSNNIVLAHTTAAQTVLNMLDVTNFTLTGTGGFKSDASVTRTFVFGTTGGSATNAPNLLFTGSGTAVQTFSTANWFNNLDFGTTAFNIGTIALNLNGFTLSNGGTFTLFAPTMRGTGTVNSNGKIIGGFTVNNSAGTVTLAGPLSAAAYTQTAGTIDFATNNLTCSTGASYAAGTLNNIGTISCTTWAETGTFTLSSGTISASTSYTVTSGSFTYSGGTITTPSFVHTAGTVTLTQPLTLTGSYTLTTGTLTITNLTLTCTGFLTTGTGTRSIVFGITGQITLTGNNITIWDGGSTGITLTGTPTIVSNYAGSVGTRTINVGTGWTESTDFDVKVGSAVGISIGSSGTDTVAIAGNISTLDLTGMLFTYSPGVMTVYGSYTIPATGGSVSASASLTTFASTQVTPVVITVSRSIDFPITFSGVGGTFNLGANFTTGATRTTTLTSGVLALNGYNYSTGLFSSAGVLARAIQFGTNTITSSGSGAVWDTGTVTNLTISGTPVVNVTNATATLTNVNPGPLSEVQSISFNFTAGTYALTFLNTAGHTAKDVNFTGFSGTLNATGVCTVYGSYTISSGMAVTTTTNLLTFGATSGTKTITTANKIMPPITINGVGGTFNLGSDITFANASTSNFSINGGTFNTNNYNINNLRNFYSYVVPANVRAINLGSSSITLTVTNSNLRFDATNLTLNAGTSTISYTAATSNNFQIDNGSLTFYNLSYASTTSNSIQTIIGTLTFNNLTGPIVNSGTSSASFVITNNITVNGTFTLPAGTATIYRCLISSATPGSQVTITAATVSLNSWNFQNINASGSIPWTGTLLGDVGNNSNITFDAGVNKYWNLPVGGNWFSVAWALTSGGTPSAANYPLPQDTCIIENTGLNTGATISVNNSTIITTLNMSSRTSSMTFNIQTNIKISLTGDWINGSGVSSITGGLGQGIFFINSTGGTQKITSAGKLFTPLITVNTFGTVKLLDNFDQDSLVGLQAFTFTLGTIDLNNFNLSTAQFTSSNSNTRAINFGTGYINLTHTTAGTVVLNMGNAQNFSATGAGGFRAAMSVTRQFDLGDSVTPNGAPTVAPNLFIFSGASIPSFTTGGYYNLLDFTGSTCTPAVTTLNLYSLTLASGGTYTNLTATMVGTGTVTGNSKTIVSLTCTSGTTTLSGTLTAPTTVNGGTLTNPTGSVLNATIFTLTTGTVNLNGGTLPTTTTFTHTAGTVNVNSATALAATGTYNFNAGTLILAANLTVGIFSSSNTNARSIVFGSNNIILAHTTAAQTVLNMTIATGFTYTSSGTFGSGTGCFQSTMSVTRTFTFGTTGGTSTNAPALYLVSGASVPTITTGSYYNEINFGTTAFTLAATTQNLNSLYSVSSTNVLTALTVNVVGTGSINSSLTLGPVTLLAGTTTIVNTLTCSTFTINGPTFNFTSGTLNPSTSFTLTSGTFTYGGTATLGAVPTFTQTAGDVTLKAYSLTATGAYTFLSGSLTLTGNLTTGTFSSNNSNNRIINFDVNNIILSTTTAAATVLDMASTTNFLYTGTGGFTSPMSVTRTFNCGTASSVSGSLSFSGAYLEYGNASQNTFNTGDFTLEAWIYLNSVASIYAIYSKAVGSGGNSMIFATSGTELYIEQNAGAQYQVVTSGANLTTGTWYHVAAVRISGVGTIYVNGVAKGSGGWGWNITADGASRVGSGRGPSSLFSGLISNFRMVKGLGVYTGNFTVPVVQLTTFQTASTNISAITGTQTSLLLNTPNTAQYLTDSSTYNSTASNFSVSSSASTPFTVLPAGGTPPNLAINSGASIPSIISGSTFNILNFTGSTCTPATASINIQGSLTLATGGTYTALTIVVTGGANVATNNKTIAAFTLNNNVNSMTLDSNGLTIAGAFTLTSGTMYAFGNITSPTFASSGTATRSIIGTNITYTVSGAGATAFSNASGTGISIVGVTISMTNAAAKTFAGGGGTYSVLNQGGAGILSITGANNFDNITNTVQPATVTFPSATTTTVGNFSLSGIAGSLITINSSTAASAATLTKSSGIVYGSYLSIRDSNATGGATWYAGLTSTSVSNNTGWIFTQLPIITMGNLTVADGGFTVSNLPV